jgi:hypothetical protein
MYFEIPPSLVEKIEARAKLERIDFEHMFYKIFDKGQRENHINASVSELDKMVVSYKNDKA